MWTDHESGVRWVVTAGLAKGGHKDHDDFYEQLELLVGLGKANSLLPSEKDRLLLKRETMARELTRWEMEIQESITLALEAVLSLGIHRIDIRHPLRPEKFAAIELAYASVADLSDGCEELVVEFIFENKFVGSELGWEARTRVLNTLCPPVQKWDRTKDIYSIVMEPGFCARQVELLRTANSDGQLMQAELGNASHYAHQRHIADSSVFGKSIRALCGVYFVPSQDHKEMPVCPNCTGVHQRLPDR